MVKQKNPIDIAVLRQLRKAPVKPSQPTFEDQHVIKTFAKNWPKLTFFSHLSKADAPHERNPVVLIEQRALEMPINMIGPKAKQRREAQRLAFESLIPKLVPSLEATKIYREEDSERNPDSRPS